MEVKLLKITDDCEKHIEFCGRECYQSHEKITKDSHVNFIKGLIKSGHESVLEHATATFLIKGISRACSHQLVRHRLFSFSQSSQRYVDESNFEWVIPKCYENDDDYKWLMNEIKTHYQMFLARKDKKEDARFILPNACTTELVMTGNFRQYRNFLKERLHQSAQWEIQYLATLILFLLNQQASNVFGDLVKY